MQYIEKIKYFFCRLEKLPFNAFNSLNFSPLFHMTSSKNISHIDIMVTGIDENCCLKNQKSQSTNANNQQWFIENLNSHIQHRHPEMLYCDGKQWHSLHCCALYKLRPTSSETSTKCEYTQMRAKKIEMRKKLFIVCDV